MHYTGTIWRPPYEASSLLLEVTAGCTHHKCKFCTLYDELPFRFRMSPMEDIEADVKEAARAASRAAFPIKRAFLTGANPFVLKFERLMAIAGLIHRYLPGCETIGCFARITDIGLKSDSELGELRAAGYDGLTIGIETGDDEALAFMHKGYSSADIVAQCKRLDRVGIRYSFFYLAGISGAGRGEAGAEATAAVCNQLHPLIVGANMLTLFPNSELYQEMLSGTWTEESELEKYWEIRVLIEKLQIPTVFAAMGASNAFQMQGALPREKVRLLSALDAILQKMDETELKQYRQNLSHL